MKAEQVVQQLRNTHLFTPADGGIWCKQELFLTWMMVKPVTSTFSDKYSDPATFTVDHGDDPEEVKSFLDNLSLFSNVWQYRGTFVQVSRSQSLLDEAIKAGEEKNYFLSSGLLGYPTSANYWRPGALLKGEHLENDEQYKLTRDLFSPEYKGGLPGFRLSKANWREEVKVLQDWYGVLQRHDFLN